MTPGAQRVAIAEMCGWTDIGPAAHFGRAVTAGMNPISGTIDPLPDYLNDLNEMYEVEKILNEPQRLWFMRYLIPDASVDIKNSVTNGMAWFMTHATAAQRAEALLRTLGKWVD